MGDRLALLIGRFVFDEERPVPEEQEAILYVLMMKQN
jgi:hypothetical protein